MTLETNIVLIGVDPGATTGIFAVTLDTSGSGPFVNDERDAHLVMLQLDRTLRGVDHRPVYVACERYVQQSTRITPQYAALETIGVVRWLCAMYAAELTLQSRSQKALVSSFMLKNIGWWTSGTKGHVNDAARHALIWLATRRPNHPLVQRTIGTIAAIG